MKKTQYEKRLSGLRAYLEDHGLAGALITSYENRRYFCGFTGSSGYPPMDEPILEPIAIPVGPPK